jgi:ABC-type uncharacterized transport system substrate-binding protein
MAMNRLRVAIVLCFNGVFHKSVSRPLLDIISVQSAGDMSAILVHVSPNQESAHRAAKKLLTDEFDVIVAVGNRCATYIKEVIDYAGGHPFLFLGASNPVALGLVDSLENPGGYCSGVNRVPVKPLAAIEKLIALAPFRKCLLLPYTPWAAAGALEKQVEAIQLFVASRSSMKVIAVPINESEDAVKAFHDHEGQFDMALILEGCAAERATVELARWCWKKDVVLCAPGIQALDEGAACAFGGDFTPYAEEAFAMIQRFWMQKIPFGQQPVQMIPDNRRFGVNIDVLRRVGLQEHEIEALCDQPDILIERTWVKL